VLVRSAAIRQNVKAIGYSIRCRDCDSASPTTGTEALRAVQMVGAQRLAMRFLQQATLDGKTVIGVDANVLRASRLMRLFSEQVETMAKLKGKGGQQRIVVEHLNVAAGGQAIVGTVIRGSSVTVWTCAHASIAASSLAHGSSRLAPYASGSSRGTVTR
jgi:hypothetical protein